MSHFTGNRLYDLLPGIYRKRDLEGDRALQHLADVIYDELNRSESRIDDLYESWFIQTCPEEVIPHIAALLGFSIEPDPEHFPTHRAMVANAMTHRLGKGTVHALEQAAAEASGWAVEVVEVSQRMAATAPMGSSMGHTGLHREARVDQPGDSLAGRTVDISRRSIKGVQSVGGNLQEVELRVARMRAAPIENAQCRTTGSGRFRLHPLDVDVPLFHLPCHDPVVALTAGLSRLPIAMDLATVRADLARHQEHARRRAEPPPSQTTWLGPGRSLALRINGAPVPAWQLELADLDDWSAPGPNLEGWRTGPIALNFETQNPSIRLQRRGQNSRKVRLIRQPTSLEDTASLLRTAIRRLGSEPVFRNCEVVALEHELVVVLGERVSASSWSLEPDPDDPQTWSALGLDRATASAALLSAEVDWEWTLPAHTRLEVTCGNSAPIPIDIAFDRGNLEALAQTMRAALDQHGTWHVSCRGNHLLLVSPREQGTAPIRVTQVGHDARPLRALGLARKVRIDPTRGRLQLPLGYADCQVRADWSFGTPLPLGAGPFGRAMHGPKPDATLWCAVVSRDHTASAQPGHYASVSDAIAAWQDSDEDGYIRILDSALYSITDDSVIYLKGRSLTLEAEDGEQPTIIGDLNVSPDGGTFTVVGLFHQGVLSLQSGGGANLQHITALGQVVVAATDAPLILNATKSILGPIRFASLFGQIVLHECIVGDGETPAISGLGDQTNAPAAALQRCTILGDVRVEELQAVEDTLFTGRVSVRRRHTGLMRSCALPARSSTCRRVQCFEFYSDEDTALDSAQKGRLPPPSFVSNRLGHPGFAQLVRQAHTHYQTGATNGHELGVYNATRHHDRLRFLRASVHEYLPVGRWADIQFVN